MTIIPVHIWQTVYVHSGDRSQFRHSVMAAQQSLDLLV